VSASERALVLAALALGGCSSTPAPGTVAIEATAVDFEACVRGDASCRKTGAVSTSEAFIPGEHAIAMSGPASISLPLMRADRASHLHFIAIGMRAINETAGRKMIVTLDGVAPITVEPNYGWTRVEVDTQGIDPAADARVTITAVEGRFDLVYNSGRWDE
jgi:hypothetical protein